MGLFAFGHPFKESVTLIFLTLIVLNVSRFLNIFLTASLANICRSRQRITFKTGFVLWISGLRGAMAYALAMKSTLDFKHGDKMLLDTLIYALFSVLVIGSLINTVLRICGVETNPDGEDNIVYDFE